jgi:hypothetical protein
MICNKRPPWINAVAFCSMTQAVARMEAVAENEKAAAI